MLRKLRITKMEKFENFGDGEFSFLIFKSQGENLESDFGVDLGARFGVGFEATLVVALSRLLCDFGRWVVGEG